MTDNNGIPFEVKKPFETVYELKNEVPSFEEFMKTYEEDESLNYDDLSYSDISEAKGYGPCYVCRLPKKWMDLYVPCPADDCPNKNNPNRRPTSWVHYRCWGDMEISIQGEIKCKKCGVSDFMGNWNFACSEHEGQHWPTSHTAFKSAVNIAFELGKGEEEVFHLYQFIKAHPEKFSRR